MAKRQSEGRILTTHVGVLEIPADVEAALAQDAAPPVLTEAVAAVVRRQVETGLDIVNDGEFGKSFWTLYAADRLDGVEWREETDIALLRGRDFAAFPEFYAWAMRTPGVLVWNQPPVTMKKPVCVGPLSYRPGAIQRDIANLKAALEQVDVVDAFLPTVAPASIEAHFGNEHYDSQEDLLYALADALHEEYSAIVEAGFQLQVDDAWIPLLWSLNSEIEPDEYRRVVATRIDALNHALVGLPPERVRYHVCWGSWHGPHAYDVPLADIVDLVLRVNAGTYLLEAANPRHEHEVRVWETTKLPEGKKLAPGVVAHSTNVIEHPELVAERIVRYAERVGADNVIASTDCGMGLRIHPELAWAKLAALVEGARLASERLYGSGARRGPTNLAAGSR
jgi:5-methyltetrahydropteroyltriglutamate--homocysteine methyltransferase